MNRSILGLSVAAVAFAGSSMYLYRQVGAERARADEVTELSRRLNARLSELEKAKADFAQRRGEPGAAFGHLAMTPGSPGMPPPPASGTEAGEVKQLDAPPMALRPDRSPAMQKMMKVQMRANSKRMYADFAEQLGLAKEQANALYDLLTEQQMASFEPHDFDPNEARSHFDELRREQQRQLADLLGPSGAEALQKYQESMPARSEVEMIARQLEGVDAGLSDDQRKRLVSALTEERGRVAQPDYSQFGSDNEAFTKALNEWQDDYNERTASRARSILETDQLSAYNEYQQWQKEMREQFAVMGPGPRRFRAAGVAVGGAIPIGPPAMVLDTVIAAPAPVQEKTKTK